MCREEVLRQGGERLNLARGRGACKTGSYLDFCQELTPWPQKYWIALQETGWSWILSTSMKITGCFLVSFLTWLLIYSSQFLQRANTSPGLSVTTWLIYMLSLTDANVLTNTTLNVVCSLQQGNSFLKQTVPKPSAAERGGINTTKEGPAKRGCLELGKIIIWLIWF